MCVLCVCVRVEGSLWVFCIKVVVALCIVYMLSIGRDFLTDLHITRTLYTHTHAHTHIHTQLLSSTHTPNTEPTHTHAMHVHTWLCLHSTPQSASCALCV